MDLNILNSFLKLHYLGNKFFVYDNEEDRIEEFYLVSISFDLDGMHYVCGNNKYSINTIKTQNLFNSREAAENYRNKIIADNKNGTYS